MAGSCVSGSRRCRRRPSTSVRNCRRCERCQGECRRENCRRSNLDRNGKVVGEVVDGEPVGLSESLGSIDRRVAERCGREVSLDESVLSDRAVSRDGCP